MKKLALHVAEVLLDSAVGAIGAAVIFTDVDWRRVALTAAFAGTMGLLNGLRRLSGEKYRKLIEKKGG